MIIRPATLDDEQHLRRIHRSAFGPDESEPIAKLAVELLRGTSVPKTLHLLAEIDGRPVGHVAFSPVSSAVDPRTVGFILAPLAVDPDHQNRGAGSAMVRQGLELLARQNVGVILVYGDPNYYARFGFRTDAAENYRPPFKLVHPQGWQAIERPDPNRGNNPIAIECVGPLNRPELW